jgi:hypothetical protein
MALYPLFVIRNSQGQYLGCFRAKNAAAAIEKLKQSDRNIASTFRKSQPATKSWGELTAEKLPEDEMEN